MKESALKIIEYARLEQTGGSDITPEELKQLKQIFPGMSEEEIRREISFNSGMGGTPTAQKLANAIKTVESGGNYNAKGASGESGAYQFMPSTWKSWAQQYLGNANAPMTKENQDKVAIMRIQDLLDQGYSAQQVALIWNGGQPVVKKGVNKYGVSYDSGAYADKVLRALV